MTTAGVPRVHGGNDRMVFVFGADAVTTAGVPRVHGGNDRMVFVFGAVAVTTALHNIMR